MSVRVVVLTGVAGGGLGVGGLKGATAVLVTHLEYAGISEDLFAELWQLIAGMKFVSFLTPDMASKNDDSYGIGSS